MKTMLKKLKLIAYGLGLILGIIGGALAIFEGQVWKICILYMWAYVLLALSSKPCIHRSEK